MLLETVWGRCIGRVLGEMRELVRFWLTTGRVPFSFDDNVGRPKDCYTSSSDRAPLT